MRWTTLASADFLDIFNGIAAENPAAAARAGRQILDTVEMLLDHPYLGKPGRSPDTREPGVARFPYLVVYSVEAGAIASDPARVAILRVLHGAMMWPPKDE
ncbi:MAG: type II toxin-antitoxin system RelE/ParE family toxin [Acetobacteraceae bacterium]|nr:type II toxin-antitoxin system RelE/ParE family toxin [Acetobacteraceae bacterium]